MTIAFARNYALVLRGGPGLACDEDGVALGPIPDRRQQLFRHSLPRLGHDIGTVEFGWPVGMPLCRSLGGALWEVRSNLPSHRTARVIFCTAQGRMVLLHGFVKRTQKTPQPDLELARGRQKEIEQ